MKAITSVKHPNGRIIPVGTCTCGNVNKVTWDLDPTKYMTARCMACIQANRHHAVMVCLACGKISDLCNAPDELYPRPRPGDSIDTGPIQQYGR